MKAILFLDDWMVEHRDSLERVWGKPELVKELFTDYYPGYWVRRVHGRVP